MNLQFFRKRISHSFHSLPEVFSGPDQRKTPENGVTQVLQFLIGCPFRDIGKSGSGSVVPEIRIRVRDLERHIQIVPDTDDDDPVTGLRDYPDSRRS